MACLYHHSEDGLPIKKDKSFHTMFVPIPAINRMNTIEKGLLIEKLQTCLKQVRYYASSILRTYLLLVILTVTITIGARAQSTVPSRFYYNGTNETVRNAIKIADEILSNEKFWTEVRNWSNQYIDNTDTASYSMAKLADTLKAYRKITNIILASSISFHISNALTNEARTLITRNGYKQDLKSLAVTIVHEWAHSVDYGMHGGKNLRFQHFNDQSRCLNKETASYRVERAAELILGNPDFAKNCPCQLPCYLPCEAPIPCPKVQ